MRTRVQRTRPSRRITATLWRTSARLRRTSDEKPKWNDAASSWPRPRSVRMHLSAGVPPCHRATVPHPNSRGARRMPLGTRQDIQTRAGQSGKRCQEEANCNRKRSQEISEGDAQAQATPHQEEVGTGHIRQTRGGWRWCETLAGPHNAELPRGVVVVGPHCRAGLRTSRQRCRARGATLARGARGLCRGRCRDGARRVRSRF
jgi:hypothetical protein